MSVNTVIEFTDLAQHTFDPSAIEILNGEARLKSQVDANEVLFANFDTDNDPVSKRGAKNIVLTGAANPSSGVLKFTPGAAEKASYLNITEIVNHFALRVEVMAIVATVITNTTILEIVSNVDLSKIEFYIQNQGSGISRIRKKITNSAGVVSGDSIMGTQNFSTTPNFSLGVSNDDAIALKFYYNGNLFDTTGFINFDFTDCDIIFNNNIKAACDFDNVQLFNRDALTSNYAFPFPEQTTFLTSDQQILTSLPLLMDKWDLFASNKTELNGSQVKYQILRNVDKYFYNTATPAWEVVNSGLDLFPQSNTDTEINDNISTFPLTEGIGAYIQIISFLKSSADGYTTPILDSLSLSYSFYFKIDDVKCNVIYGTIYDQAKNPVVDAKIRFQSSDKFYGGAFVGPSVFAITNSEGRFSIGIIETQTDGTTVDITVEYTEKQLLDGNEFDALVVYEYKNRVIPNLGSTRLSDLIALA